MTALCADGGSLALNGERSVTQRALRGVKASGSVELLEVKIEHLPQHNSDIMMLLPSVTNRFTLALDKVYKSW